MLGIEIIGLIDIRMKIFFKQFLNIGTFLLVLGILLVFNGSILALMYNITADPALDILELSSMGFIVFIAVTYVCFTWAKTFENKDPELAERLNTAGRYAILASVCLLLGSFFKYMLISKLLAIEILVNQLSTSQVLQPAFVVCFLVSGLSAMYIITDLLFLISSNHWLKKTLSQKEEKIITEMVEEALLPYKLRLQKLKEEVRIMEDMEQNVGSIAFNKKPETENPWAG